MTESAGSAPPDAAATRAADQARLRKERREAKIKAGGSARLNKITGLGGGFQRDTEPESLSQQSEASAPDLHDADPEEVDISQHFYTPQSTPRSAHTGTPALDPANMSDSQLRQLMLGFEQPGMTPPQNPFGPGSGHPLEDDPMLKMLSQMMGGTGIPGMGNNGNEPFANPSLATTPTLPDRYSSLWRLAHFAVAMGLGLYIALWTRFTGSRAEREQSAFEHSVGHVTEQDVFKQYFFYAFATAETVLLTSRFFLDRGRAPPAGALWTVVGFLPEPAKGYVSTALRYGQIFTTVRSDILVCVFVLGACSWLRGT